MSKKKYCFRGKCFSVDGDLEVEDLNKLNRIHGVHIISICSGHKTISEEGASREAHLVFVPEVNTNSILKNLHTFSNTKVIMTVMHKGIQVRGKTIPEDAYIFYEIMNKNSTPSSNKIWIKNISNMLSKIKFSVSKYKNNNYTRYKHYSTPY